MARGLHLTLNEGEVETYKRLVADMLPTYSRLQALYPSEAQAPTRHYSWPGPNENPYCGWFCLTEITSHTEGPLRGKTVALKDNISVAGLPMTIGLPFLEGYIAGVDATVVTRILEAGGTIAGKAVCETLCYSGGSHTSSAGVVRNPHDPQRSSGGSSSGNAALLAAGSVDLGIGGDQGGSIRIPSSWCGVYGLKPTYGLVPYTGIFSFDVTLDHAGPMARSAEDVALLLDAIAGPDGVDERQRLSPDPQGYREGLRTDVSGLRVGLVEEGFSWDVSESDVDEAVREAAHSLQKVGCAVRSVSIPWHREGHYIHTAIAAEGCLMAASNAAGTNWKGLYLTKLMEAYSVRLNHRANDLPNNVKRLLLAGRYMQDTYSGAFYGMAQNLAPVLASGYAEAFRDYDLLVMPTATYKAQLLPDDTMTTEEQISRTSGMHANACSFDVTGHPAVNVPCAMSQGLPVGMMLVGRHGDDGTVLRAAHAFQERVYSPSWPAREK